MINTLPTCYEVVSGRARASAANAGKRKAGGRRIKVCADARVAAAKQRSVCHH